MTDEDVIAGRTVGRICVAFSTLSVLVREGAHTIGRLVDKVVVVFATLLVVVEETGTNSDNKLIGVELVASAAPIEHPIKGTEGVTNAAVKSTA